jgi:hypothetical protein
LAREIAGRAALVAASILLTLAGLELACRLSDGARWLVHWPNFVLYQAHASGPDHQTEFLQDPVIGWLPTPGYTSAEENYDADGFRVVPGPVPGAKDAPPVLVTGASFATSEEVHDDEAMPARLQALIGRRTINAGVSAYGLDQVVMRSGQLAQSLKPAAMVVVVTADGVRRDAMSEIWWGPKPYYALDERGAPVLHNVPVPTWSRSRDNLTFWQRAFGWSKLVETVMQRLDGHDAWISGNTYAMSMEAGEALTCPLMQRVKALDVPTLVVALYEPLVWRGTAAFRAEHLRLSRLLLDCAARAGLATLDLFQPTDRLVQERGVDALYLVDHYSALGNRLAAEAIAAELRRLKLIEPALQTR